jgi:hypothetical protein
MIVIRNNKQWTTNHNLNLILKFEVMDNLNIYIFLNSIKLDVDIIIYLYFK